MWLDCLNANYFAELAWRGESCDIGSTEHSEQRKQRLSSLDLVQSVAVALLLSDADLNVKAFTNLSTTSWHRISLHHSRGLPVAVASNFDFGAQVVRMMGLEYEGQCSDGETTSLLAVFNLNFVPDANLDGRTRTTPNVPPGGSSGGTQRSQSEPENGTSKTSQPSKDARSDSQPHDLPRYLS
jgi:hypothetical protein